MKQCLLVACALAVCMPTVWAAEERWSWSTNSRRGGREALVENEQRRQERLEDFDEGERTTQKPQQDEFFGGDGTQRFNFNTNNGQFPGGGNPRYPQGPGGFPGGVAGFGPQGFGPVGPVQFPNNNGFNGVGNGFNQRPNSVGVGVGVNQFGPNAGPQYGGGGFGGPGGYNGQGGFGGPGGFNNGFGGGPGGINDGFNIGFNNGFNNGLGGPNGINNNVLVGPGGPTGIVGRPPQNQRLPAQPAVLVGPGGPTGVVGRPNGFGNIGVGRPVGGGYGLLNGNNVAPNGYGGGYGGQGSFNNIAVDVNTFQRPQGFNGVGGVGGPIGFNGGAGPYGGFRPYNSGSQIPAFDEPETDVKDQKRKLTSAPEKKSKH